MVLIDTHVLIWLILESKRLSKRAGEAIRQARAESSVLIADITIWELAWLVEKRRIGVVGAPERFLEDAIAKVIVRPITRDIAMLAARLPAEFPRDPIDRLIAATAISEGIPLVTADERIRASHVVSTIW